MAIFDAHLHIIQPGYPLVENQGFLPDPFTVDDYLKQAAPLGVRAGAVVSGSFQAFDQSYLIDALERLGDDFVGVTQLHGTVTDEELLFLHEKGVRALRFNLKRGGSASSDVLKSFANRVYQLLGWHVELYAGADALSELKDVISSLPKVSIDHLGLETKGLPLLQELVATGCYVKATGFGRIDFDPYSVVRRLYDENPGALVFGTDLPCTRAPKPFEAAHLYNLSDILSTEELHKVCWQNALALYGLS